MKIKIENWASFHCSTYNSELNVFFSSTIKKNYLTAPSLD